MLHLATVREGKRRAEEVAAQVRTAVPAVWASLANAEVWLASMSHWFGKRELGALRRQVRQLQDDRAKLLEDQARELEVAGAQLGALLDAAGGPDADTLAVPAAFLGPLQRLAATTAAGGPAGGRLVCPTQVRLNRRGEGVHAFCGVVRLVDHPAFHGLLEATLVEEDTGFQVVCASVGMRAGGEVLPPNACKDRRGMDRYPSLVKVHFPAGTDAVFCISPHETPAPKLRWTLPLPPGSANFAWQGAGGNLHYSAGEGWWVLPACGGEKEAAALPSPVPCEPPAAPTAADRPRLLQLWASAGMTRIQPDEPLDLLLVGAQDDLLLAVDRERVVAYALSAGRDKAAYRCHSPLGATASVLKLCRVDTPGGAPGFGLLSNATQWAFGVVDQGKFVTRGKLKPGRPCVAPHVVPGQEPVLLWLTPASVGSVGPLLSAYTLPRTWFLPTWSPPAAAASLSPPPT